MRFELYNVTLNQENKRNQPSENYLYFISIGKWNLFAKFIPNEYRFFNKRMVNSKESVNWKQIDIWKSGKTMETFCISNKSNIASNCQLTKALYETRLERMKFVSISSSKLLNQCEYILSEKPRNFANDFCHSMWNVCKFA